jgi:hypothetical protein
LKNKFAILKVWCLIVSFFNYNSYLTNKIICIKNLKPILKVLGLFGSFCSPI